MSIFQQIGMPEASNMQMQLLDNQFQPHADQTPMQTDQFFQTTTLLGEDPNSYFYPQVSHFQSNSDLQFSLEARQHRQWQKSNTDSNCTQHDRQQISKEYTPKRRRGLSKVSKEQNQNKLDTKNMLSSMSKIIFNYIKEVDPNLDCQALTFFKKYPNIANYQRIFTNRSLKKVLAQMFLQRVLVGGVMISRAKKIQKSTYLKYIDVLKLAFLNQQFVYIR